jgi:hypothetical protein
MSAEKKKSSYVPSEPPPKEDQLEEPRMSASFYQEQQRFFFDQAQLFKKLFEDSTLAKWIVMAGISGVIVAALEIVHLIWLAIRYVWKF